MEEYEYIKKLDADLAIVVAYGQIIPKSFEDLTKDFLIYMHLYFLNGEVQHQFKVNNEFR